MVYSEKFSISYTGSAKEEALSLNRGSSQHIRKIHISAAAADADAYVVAINKATASTANNRNASHADSTDVWMGEAYLMNTSTLVLEEPVSLTDPKTVEYIDNQLRLYMDLGSNSMTVYVTVEYDARA